MAISPVAVGAKITAAITNLIIVATNAQGQTGVVPTSVAGTGASVGANGVVTVATGGASVSINGCFTSVYDNYFISVKATMSTGAALQLRLRVGGADASGASDYTVETLTKVGAAVTGAASAVAFAAIGTLTSPDHRIKLFLDDPFNAVATYMECTDSASNGSAHAGSTLEGRHILTTAYDGFSLLAASGTITAATIRIYGINNN